MSTMTKLSELTGDYVFDTARTRIGFVARHAMATRVRGQFDAFEGSAYLDGDDPSKSSARLTIEARSIQTRNRQRDDQLRGTFLDIDHHPAITFTSSQVEQVDETRFEVTGDLAVRGVTRAVTVDLELTGAGNDPRGGIRVGFKGSVTIDRNDWGVNWNAATRIMVSPKVTLEFDVSAVRRS
ncbi:YceI family protein [Nonomuraea sp. 3-1Str]|uniref:YceI family protein n=1 Tax=Nonomuraea sp. 3-1Str TaxID=2929801 RepID=UPI002859CA5C|nr:YceI family protein [Nonomuraea sp. 3-1Str]MDR8412412.1 YceI family protein [Nonomuraea sp. 3-1Str]